MIYIYKSTENLGSCNGKLNIFIGSESQEKYEKGKIKV